MNFGESIIGKGHRNMNLEIPKVLTEKELSA